MTVPTKLYTFLQDLNPAFNVICKYIEHPQLQQMLLDEIIENYLPIFSRECTLLNDNLFYQCLKEEYSLDDATAMVFVNDLDHACAYHHDIPCELQTIYHQYVANRKNGLTLVVDIYHTQPVIDPLASYRKIHSDGGWVSPRILQLLEETADEYHPHE